MCYGAQGSSTVAFNCGTTSGARCPRAQQVALHASGVQSHIWVGPGWAAQPSLSSAAGCSADRLRCTVRVHQDGRLGTCCSETTRSFAQAGVQPSSPLECIVKTDYVNYLAGCCVCVGQMAHGGYPEYRRPVSPGHLHLAAVHLAAARLMPLPWTGDSNAWAIATCFLLYKIRCSQQLSATPSVED